ncbi:MAG: hypothetical protein AAGA54_34095, partial [Myxococcota bacterium]
EAQLERSTGENEASDEPTDEEQIEFLSRMFNPSPAQLLEAAKNCELSYATPSAYPDGRYLSPAAVEKIGLEPDEVELLRRSLDGSRDRWVEQLRSIYVDATGDESGAGELSEAAMQAEVLSKAVHEDLVDSRERVVKERAGMLPAPARGDGSPVERFYRQQLERSADVYSAVTEAVGEDRAYSVLGSLRMNMANYRDCSDG